MHRMSPPALTREERDLLTGSAGPATALAMRVIVSLAEASEAPSLVEITSAHVGSDLLGQSSLDFLRRLVSLGAAFRVPTTLNIASFDRLHPELYRGDATTGAAAREVMDLAVQLGGRQTWTCTPYLLDERPAFGECVAWSESGPVVFANSVLGARTDRTGIFTDLCAALTGRMPRTGLYVDEHRRGEVRVDVTSIPPELFADDLTLHLLGYWIGRRCGSSVPVLEGLPRVDELKLQLLSTTLATSGGVGMFHAVGITPEAPSLEVACGGDVPIEVLVPQAADLADVRQQLSTAGSGQPDAYCLGVPQYSLDAFDRLLALLDADERRVDSNGAFLVNTSRHVLERLRERGREKLLAAYGVTLVTDTCTYMAPILDQSVRVVMTDSAKWAHYGGPLRHVDVLLATTAECVRTARGDSSTGA